MKAFLLTTLSIALLTSASASTVAQAAPRIDNSAQFRLVTLQVQLATRPLHHMSLWVSYGPLGGRFGVIRLGQVGPLSFAATHQFPLHGRSMFTYLASYRMVQTPVGMVPDYPLIMIRSIGPVAAWQLPAEVRWAPPVG
jgi:hypothetical protein